MKRAWCIGASICAVLLAALPVPAYATCPANSNPVQHALGGWYADCADAQPVAAFIYTLGNQTGINSGNVDVAYEDGSSLNGQGNPCDPTAGAPGDGVVTISFDYLGPGTYPGCPNPSLNPTAPRQVVQVVDNNGNSLLASMGWSNDLGQYGVDFAQVVNPDTFATEPLHCDRNSAGLMVESFDGTTLRARLSPATLHTDCDPGTWGAGAGFFAPICDTATLPVNAPGMLYSKFDRCGTSPNPMLGAGWTVLATPDATGLVTAVVPRSDLADTCTFVGASGSIGGVETLTTVATLQIAGTTAPAPRALAVRARRAGGEVILTWNTAAELDLLGFDIYTIDAKGGKGRIKVNESLIAALGGPTGAGAQYEHRVPMSRLQGGKTFIVQSVLRTGRTLDSDPASF